MSWLKRSAGPKKPVNWKVNLAALWVSQFLTLSSFYFCLPFLPLYLRENNIVPADEVTYWAGIFSSAGPVSMMIISPIWGILGDQYGRKMMLVRATLSGAFCLYLMGTVTNIEALIVLRMLQGAFTGTVPSAQTLVVTNTPDKNQGFAVGLLMAAVNAGYMAGTFFGGQCARYYGAVMTFKIAGFMLLAATVLVVALVRENFVRPEKLPQGTQSARLRRRRESLTNFRAGVPIFLTIGFIALVQSYDGPFLSLYVDALYRRGLETAAVVMSDAAITSEVYGVVGIIGGIASLAAMLGSIAVGTVMDKKLPDWIWAGIAAVSAAGLFWVSSSDTMTGLVIGRSIFLFFINGLASVGVVILSRMTPSSKRGAALGWSNTARSMGWAIAPISGAHIADAYGFPSSYLVLAIVCSLLVPTFLYLDKRYRQAFHPMDDDPPSINSVGQSHVSSPGGQGRMG